MNTYAAQLVRAVISNLSHHPTSAVFDHHHLDETFAFDEIDLALIGLHLAQLGRRFGVDVQTFPHHSLDASLTVGELVAIFAEWAELDSSDGDDPAPTLRVAERVSYV